MSRTILTQVDGFTPLPDLLVKRYGLMTAAVWGRMWRYCQMENGVCQAKLETIAAELNISERSVMRHIENLTADGFMQDTTPDLKNRPHTYADTGKVAMYNRFGIGVTESHPAMTESHRTVTESHPEGDTESHEDSIKRESKRGASPQKKGDMLDGMIAFSREHQPELQMRQRFENCLRLSPDWDKHAPRDTWEGFDLWLVERDRAGQSIEDWAKWWKSDDFQAKQTIHLTPDKIKKGWLLAFTVQEVYEEM